MIARVWRGRTRPAQAEEYRRFLIETGVADYRATPGNAGVWLLQRDADEATEFVLITHWISRDAIAAFAGADIERAKYYPRDEAFLLEREPRVLHYALETFG